MPPKDGPGPPGDATSVLRAAIRAVPATKYALGVAGVGAAAAVVLGFLGSPTAAVVGVAVTLAFSTVLLVFAHLARQKPSTFHGPTTIVLWGVTVLFVATLTALFASFFFGKPLDLRPSRGAASMGSARPPAPGSYRCSVDQRPLTKCCVEGDPPHILSFATREDDGILIDQFVGAFERKDACFAVALTSTFSDGSTDKPRVGPAGTLLLCQKEGTWSGSWSDIGHVARGTFSMAAE